jgi:RNA polymerase sigma-B factor
VNEHGVRTWAARQVAGTGTRWADGGARRERLREDRALFQRLAREPTPATREAVIERFLPLARGLALRYAGHSSEPLDDLFQVAALGLMKAVDRYDVGRGIAFTSYAVPTILGEIKRYFRDRTWSLHVPRDLQELTLAVQAQRAELEACLERAPTVAEIAEALDVLDEDVLDGLQAAHAQRATSLDAPSTDDGGHDGSIHERIGGDDLEMQQAEARASLDTLMSALPRRSQFVLRLRFHEEMTQREIGVVIGVSQMQVSRILRESIDRLRQVALARRESASDLIAV